MSTLQVISQADRPVHMMDHHVESVGAAFAKWRHALSQMSAEDVADLYDNDSMLLATLDPHPITSREERIAYFERLIKSGQITVDVDSQHIRMLDGGHAMVSGLYTFVITKGQQISRIPARYTFVFQQKEGKWVILEHHSSRAPSSPTN